MTQLESLWELLSREHERPVFRRINDVHPLDLYAGVELGEERVLMLVSQTEPPNPPEFEAIQVIKSFRGDGRWILAMRLRRPDLLTPFSRLCGDLIESTSNSGSPDGPAAVMRHLSRWKRLMQLSHSGLSDSEVRGLIGELLLLESLFMPRFGPLAAVKGWTGPGGAPQDFRLPGLAIEVKTCQYGSNKVAISSLDQLDGMGDRLLLVVTALSPSSEFDAKALTLSQLVRRVRSSLSSEQEALEELDVRLGQTGFVESDKAASVFYRPEHTVGFNVAPGFPKLTRSVVPQGLLEATYVLDLGACSRFQCDLGVIGHADI